MPTVGFGWGFPGRKRGRKERKGKEHVSFVCEKSALEIYIYIKMIDFSIY